MVNGKPHLHQSVEDNMSLLLVEILAITHSHSCIYGKSKKCITFDPRLTADGKWEATFTPICGGQHVITASRDPGYYTFSQSNATAMFTVTGMPPVGSRVVRGPD